MSSHTHPQNVQVAALTARVATSVVMTSRSSYRRHVDVDAFRLRHAGARRAPTHQPRRVRTIRDAQHAARQLVLARHARDLDGRLGVLDAYPPTLRDSEALHVGWMHADRAGDLAVRRRRLVTDAGALLRRPAGDQYERLLHVDLF